MNNYINIDKISASLIASVYFSAVIFIYTIVNTVSVVMFRACEKKSVNSANLSFL